MAAPSDQPPTALPQPPVAAAPDGASRVRAARAMALAGARQHVLPLVLIGLAALFDYRLQGSLLETLMLAALASAPFLFAPVVRPIARALFSWVPEHWRGFLAATVPTVVLYLTRWRGEQPTGTAILVIGVPVAIGVALTRGRDRIGAWLAPFARARDRALPRWARIALVGVLPILLVFAFVHRDLGDVTALFGGTTEHPNLVNSPGTATRMVVATTLSAIVGFLLLAQPPEDRQ